MKLWLTVFNKSISEYKGNENLPFEYAGIDWFVFRAISPADAEKQTERYLQRKHSGQDELNRIGRTLRVLAAEDEEKARAYFDQLYPIVTNKKDSQPDVITLKLEAIGIGSLRKIREMSSFIGESVSYRGRLPWVAEITGTHPKYKLARSFLDHKTSYEEASSTGDRGVYFFFNLHAGRMYEVNSRVSRKHWYRYFCKIKSGKQIILTEEEVLECLKNMG